MVKVLLIDDDSELTAMLAEYLAQENFEARAVADGESGAAEALSGDYAIVVLDVMLPRLSGIETLRRIRQLRDCPIRVREGDATGYGIMETIIHGAHPEIGLTTENSLI